MTHIPDSNKTGTQDLADVEALLTSDKNVITLLQGNGDFRSPECIKALQEADIVVSNPPFSLFRDYIHTLISHEKKFLVLGNQNAITYKEIYPLIKANKLWLGYNNGGTKWFQVPDDYTHTTTKSRIKVENGKRYLSMGSVYWFTNLDTTKRHEELTLVKRYTPEEYPTYDNDEAIEVARYNEIPDGYAGTMGVPLTYLQYYNPEQFEIVKFRKGNDGKDLTINGHSKYFRIVIRNKNLER
ncbi:adenine-specific methyltransferase EcoRI family protein [Rothia sp. ZJ932]|uniref:adenine-specific methyltransferase EcoRI family protein n=1 Tax=Rothia sp. ZJ932 TaxID=2810516 RepID=UPI001967CEEF|nr:hypothetical protein JR346_01350 [Rothia sp. ZJ932]